MTNGAAAPMYDGQRIATRAEHAYDRLVNCLAERGEITIAEAKHVANLYLSRGVRAATLDVVGGGFTLARGGYMDGVVIRRALDGPFSQRKG